MCNWIMWSGLKLVQHYLPFSRQKSLHMTGKKTCEFWAGYILAKNDMWLIVVVVTNFLRLGCRLFARSFQNSSPSGSCVTSNFQYSPWERKHSQTPGGCLACPPSPPPHLGLNSELCIVPSYVANDAENSALRFIKAGFHMLEKSWTIIVQDFSNICGNPV